VLVSVAAIVIVSVVAFVVMLTLEPAAKVNVSVLPPAATVVCPETATFEKAFWLTSAPVAIPFNLVRSALVIIEPEPALVTSE